MRGLSGVVQRRWRVLVILWIAIDEYGRGLVCDKSHNAVTKKLDFSIHATSRPMENIIYPGGYTYIYAETRNGTEAFPIKIAPELYKEKK